MRVFAGGTGVSAMGLYVRFFKSGGEEAVVEGGGLDPRGEPMGEMGRHRRYEAFVDGIRTDQSIVGNSFLSLPRIDPTAVR